MQRLLLAALMAAALVAAEPRALASESFDRKAVVAKVAELVEEMYVDPKTGRELAAHLRRRQEQGAFDQCGSPAALADAVTKAMREVADDKHLNLRYGQDPGISMPRSVRIEGPAPAGSGSPVVRRIVGQPGESRPEAAGDSPGARRVVVAPDEATRPAAERGPERSGVARVERLEGNVGYIGITGFPPGDRNRAALASAMNLLEDTDALVLDVSRCPGGTPGSVLFLESYFFPPEPKEMLARYDRGMDRTDRDFTLKEIPGKRRPDVPVFVVVGPSTGSACESIAYALQKHGRATVVGERTAGAGYNNVLMTAGEGFTVSISVAKPVHPKTGKGWEGTGVEPDVATPAGRAVSAAHREALKTVLAGVPAERRRAVEWAIEAARARESAAAETGSALAAYAGRYGAREFTVSDGALFYRSAAGRSFGPLLSLGGGKFLAGEDLRVIFEKGAGGAVAAVSIETPAGLPDRFARIESPLTAEVPCSSEKGKKS